MAQSYNARWRGAGVWLIGTVSKTVVAFVATVGSNPTLSASLEAFGIDKPNLEMEFPQPKDYSAGFEPNAQMSVDPEQTGLYGAIFVSFATAKRAFPSSFRGRAPIRFRYYFFFIFF